MQSRQCQGICRGVNGRKEVVETRDENNYHYYMENCHFDKIQKGKYRFWLFFLQNSLAVVSESQKPWPRAELEKQLGTSGDLPESILLRGREMPVCHRSPRSAAGGHCFL